MQLIPAYMRRVLESRVNRWYGELKFIENDLNPESQSGLDLTRFLLPLNAIDKTLLEFASPKDLMARCCTLHPAPAHRVCAPATLPDAWAMKLLLL